MAGASVAKISQPRFRVFSNVTSGYLWRIALASDPDRTVARFRHLDIAMVTAKHMNEEAKRNTPAWQQCAWCSPESSRGACDGGHPCPEIATVHDLEADQPFCLKHFCKRDGVR